MPGRIMTAQQAKKEMGDICNSIKKKGNQVTMRNGQGKKVTVSKNKEVYHRGHCRFGVYSESLDKARGSGKDKLGKGNRRQTHD